MNTRGSRQTCYIENKLCTEFFFFRFLSTAFSNILLSYVVYAQLCNFVNPKRINSLMIQQQKNFRWEESIDTYRNNYTNYESELSWARYSPLTTFRTNTCSVVNCTLFPVKTYYRQSRFAVCVYEHVFTELSGFMKT